MDDCSKNDYYAARGFRAVLGPYDVYAIRAPVAKEVVSVGFDEVRGGNLTVEVQDNLSIALPAGTDPEFSDNRFLACAVVEVQLVALTKGVADVLVTQAMRQVTGPLSYHFEDDQAFDNISIRARMLRGGSRFPNPGSTLLFNGSQFYARLGVVINSARRIREKGKERHG